MDEVALLARFVVEYFEDGVDSLSEIAKKIFLYQGGCLKNSISHEKIAKKIGEFRRPARKNHFYRALVKDRKVLSEEEWGILSTMTPRGVKYNKWSSGELISLIKAMAAREKDETMPEMIAGCPALKNRSVVQVKNKLKLFYMMGPFQIRNYLNNLVKDKEILGAKEAQAFYEIYLAKGGRQKLEDEFNRTKPMKALGTKPSGWNDEDELLLCRYLVLNFRGKKKQCVKDLARFIFDKQIVHFKQSYSVEQIYNKIMYIGNGFRVDGGVASKQRLVGIGITEEECDVLSVHFVKKKKWNAQHLHMLINVLLNVKEKDVGYEKLAELYLSETRDYREKSKLVQKLVKLRKQLELSQGESGVEILKKSYSQEEKMQLLNVLQNKASSTIED